MIAPRIAVLLAGLLGVPALALSQESSMVRIQQFSCNVKDGSAGGSLRNISKQSLTDVRIRVTWRNEQGKSLLQTQVRPKNLPLAPGKSSTFSARAEVPEAASKCDADVVRAG